MSRLEKTKLNSRIFTPYRTLGLCSNHVPLCTHYNAKQRETYAITCVGRAFHSYKCSNFGLTWISDAHNAPISCMASDEYYLYTGCENVITAFFHGGKIAHRYVGHTCEITHLLPMGDHLLSIDVSGALRVWNTATEELHAELNLSPEHFELTAMCHPLTYVNKVLFGSRQGSLELWNVRLMKQLYKFSGWNSAVTVVKQSPAIDIVAVGLATGGIALHNIRSDETLLQFTHDDGPVASITFRTDEGFANIMLSGSQLGHIAVWNLEKRQLAASMRNAHSAIVTGLCCIDGEPLVLSSSPDNSLRLWIFDQPDSSGRLLRERSGHSAPLTCIKFHSGEASRNDPENIVVMLSAGLDGSLRAFSPFSDADNRSLGRASYNKKQMRKAKGEKRERYLMPPIVDFASEPARQSDWDSIVCCHENLNFATSWDLNHFTMGSYRFAHEDSRKAVNHGVETRVENEGVISSLNKSYATACAMTPCGNFALIGFNTGFIDVFNIQSGIYRGTYSSDPKKSPVPPAHGDSIRGIAVDAVNSTVVTADCSQDGVLHFWRFRGRQLIGSLSLGAPINKILICRENSLLAVALDDFRLLVVDIDLRRIVRVLQPNHAGKITGLTFSPDGRWLISSSMDCTIRTWDMPTSCLVDCFVTSSRFPPLGIAMSPIGDFLASIHRDQLGISLWTNRALFDFVSLHPPLGQADVDKIVSESHAELPATDTDNNFVSQQENEGAGVVPIGTLNDGLLKISLEPETKWFSLFNLDIIRERNRPKLPPQKPVNVPFFLPTVPGLEPQLAVAPETQENEKKKSGRNLASLPLSSWTAELAKLDSNTNDQSEFCKMFDRLRSLGPSSVDLELRLITNDESDSSSLIATNFLRCIKAKLESNDDFDLAVAYLARFLKLNGYRLAQKTTILRFLSQEIVPLLMMNWERVQSVCNRSLAVISFAKAPLVL